MGAETLPDAELSTGAMLSSHLKVKRSRENVVTQVIRAGSIQSLEWQSWLDGKRRWV
jgi:hypothetical protein